MPLWRIGPVSKNSGTGLGLALSFSCLHGPFYSFPFEIFLHHLLDFIPLDCRFYPTTGAFFSMSALRSPVQVAFLPVLNLKCRDSFFKQDSKCRGFIASHKMSRTDFHQLWFMFTAFVTCKYATACESAFVFRLYR